MKAMSRRAPEVRRIGDERRGWGQAVWVRGTGYQWPNGQSVANFDYTASLCDQLRYAIAHHARSSYAIAAAAGVSRAAIDRFMRGDDDAISLSKAAAVARLVGHRLSDQAVVEGLWGVYEQAGEPTVRLPRHNSLERRAWKEAAGA